MLALEITLAHQMVMGVKCHDLVGTIRRKMAEMDDVHQLGRILGQQDEALGHLIDRKMESLYEIMCTIPINQNNMVNDLDGHMGVRGKAQMQYILREISGQELPNISR